MNIRTKSALSFAAVLTAGLFLTQPMYAQVVNSGPSATSSNSRVTLTATVPSVVYVNVVEGQSTLSKALDISVIDSPANIASTDFSIKGEVLFNSPTTSIQCTVSAVDLALTNGTDTINTKLSGTIGGVGISTSGFSPIFTNKKASINISGDIDESTVTSQKAPGAYTGTVTITATVL